MLQRSAVLARDLRDSAMATNRLQSSASVESLPGDAGEFVQELVLEGDRQSHVPDFACVDGASTCR